MQGLDFVVSEAGKYGIRLILSLVNNWKEFGGKNQYVQWAKERGQNVKTEDDFFTHPVVKQYYKDHIKVSGCLCVLGFWPSIAGFLKVHT